MVVLLWINEIINIYWFLFLERPIAIDWAVPKEKFQSGGSADVDVKSEPEDNEDEVKTEVEEEKSHQKKSTKIESKKRKHDEDDSDEYVLWKFDFIMFRGEKGELV